MNSTLTIWDVRKNHRRNQLPLVGQLNASFGLPIHPNGKDLVCLAKDLQKIPITGPEKTPPAKFTLKRLPEQMVFSHDGKKLWSISKEYLWVSRWSDHHAEWETIKTSSSGLDDLFSIDAGKQWVAVGGRDGMVMFFSQKNPDVRSELAVADNPVHCLSFRPDDSHLAIGMQSGLVHLVDMNTRKIVQSHQNNAFGVVDLDFSSDGQFLAVASQNNTLDLYRFSNNRLVPYFSVKLPRAVSKLEFHPREANLLGVLVQGEPSVRIWHLDRIQNELSKLGLAVNAK